VRRSGCDVDHASHENTDPASACAEIPGHPNLQDAAVKQGSHMAWRVLGVFIAALLCLYAAVCAYLYAAQRHLIYLPESSRQAQQTPDFVMSRDGVVLRGWVVNPGQTKALLYFGGNAERIENLRGDFSRWFPDRTIYLLPYRGYGMSSGEPGETALISDALALYDNVAAHHTGVAVIGRSLGSGIAVQLAARRPLERLALVTPFDSLLRVAQEAYPFMPVSLLLNDRYESWRFAGQVHCPVLVLRAGDDQLISAARTAHLVASFAAPPEELVMAGAGHNSIQEDPAYQRALRAFLR
jgi:pimeloyl-ACP methyl ester carboxylesterase